MNISEIKEKLKKAIDCKVEISIIYNKERTSRNLRPYHFGTLGSKTQLHAYQTDGPSVSGAPNDWKNFDLSKIQEISIKNKNFTPPDKGYNPNSHQYRPIEYQIKY